MARLDFDGRLLKLPARLHSDRRPRKPVGLDRQPIFLLSEPIVALRLRLSCQKTLWTIYVDLQAYSAWEAYHYALS